MAGINPAVVAVFARALTTFSQQHNVARPLQDMHMYHATRTRERRSARVANGSPHRTMFFSQPVGNLRAEPVASDAWDRQDFLAKGQKSTKVAGGARASGQGIVRASKILRFQAQKSPIP